jgi:tetratricopeptide (TPR) repeat protein
MYIKATRNITINQDKDQTYTKLSYLRMLLSIEPRNHSGRYNLARTYQQLWLSAKALDAINVAITIDPNQWNYWYQKTSILSDMKDYWKEYDIAKENYENLKK